MAEFDLSKLMKDVSVPDTSRQRIEYIPLDSIDPDPLNFYSLDGIEELAGSIEMLGLQQPLLVRPGEGKRYTVISGHRRRAAILLIRDGGSGQFDAGVPCVVDRAEASAALRELKLIMANSDTRKMTSADQNRQAERIEDLLRQLEDEGYEFPGRLRDWVSKLSGMSRTKLARLKVIRENLIDELAQDYDAGTIGETVAYALAQQTPKMQGFIKRHYFIEDLTEEDVRNIAGMRAPKAEAKPAPAPEPASGPDTSEGLADRLAAEVEQRRVELAQEDQDFLFILGMAAPWFMRHLGNVGSRKDGIETLKSKLGSSYAGFGRSEWNVETSPKGVTASSMDYKIRKIHRTWTETYDVLCGLALHRAAAADKENGRRGVNWHNTAREGPPPADAQNVITWGEGGLHRPLPELIRREFELLPEHHQWWAVVNPPKEETE